jgi:hypothetical protein
MVESWTKEFMNEYSKILELQETLVLMAVYEQRVVTLEQVEKLVFEDLKNQNQELNYDKGYVECIFRMVTNPTGKVYLEE